MIRDKWLYGKKKDKDIHEMKVKVPLEMHTKLHGLKLLNNIPISVSVCKALTAYFNRLREENPRLAKILATNMFNGDEAADHKTETEDEEDDG